MYVQNSLFPNRLKLFLTLYFSFCYAVYIFLKWDCSVKAITKLLKPNIQLESEDIVYHRTLNSVHVPYRSTVQRIEFAAASYSQSQL